MNRDFRDRLAEFNAHGVEYLVVGAHALAAHGHVRATKDLALWVRPAGDNGAPGLVFQIGVAPLRIDIMTSIDRRGRLRRPARGITMIFSSLNLDRLLAQPPDQIAQQDGELTLWP